MPVMRRILSTPPSQLGALGCGQEGEASQCGKSHAAPGLTTLSLPSGTKARLRDNSESGLAFQAFFVRASIYVGPGSKRGHAKSTQNRAHTFCDADVRSVSTPESPWPLQ